MENRKQRFAYIDFAKGFAIVLLILSHTMAGENSIKTWICSFHMPIFFIICGLLTQLRVKNGFTRVQDVKALLLRRLRQLGIPYIVFCTALAVFYCGLSFVSKHTIPWRNYVFQIISLQGIDSLWFIPCYFAAELLLYVSLPSPKTRIITSGLAAAALVVLCVYRGEMPSFWLYRLLLKALISYIFVYIGYWCGAVSLIERLPLWLGIFFLILGIPLSQLNGFSAIGSLELNHGELFFFNATVTSVAVLSVFYRLENANSRFRILSFYGRDSIVILCTNNLLIEIIRLLDYKLTNNLLLELGITGCIIFTVFLLGLEAVLIKLSQGKFGLAFGRIPGR